MKPAGFFHHCPQCGTRQEQAPSGAVFSCVACGWYFHFNPTVATAAFLQREDGRYLFIRRGRNPAKGMLAPPGGFMDFRETAEEGVCREVREEVGLEVDGLRLLCTFTNDYLYREVTYPVVDIFFTARAVNPDSARAMDDAAGLLWLAPEEVRTEELAFESMRRAWRKVALASHG